MTRALVCMLILVAFVLSACAAATVEVRRAGNTFTVIGHEGDESPQVAQNLVARAAGHVCADHGMTTREITKIGDQRIIVLCER